MISITSRSGSASTALKRLFFHQAPGLFSPQYGQAGSSRLINRRQPGQSKEFLFDPLGIVIILEKLLVRGRPE
jgi:hypothetical protein